MESKYLSDYDKKYNHRLIKLFEILLQIIEQNSLQYWTCGGTTLGVVRHQGFIPWDDDIDIYMPRNDYETLISLFPAKSTFPYYVVSPNDKGYFLPYAKFIDRRTTLWESEEYPFISGVFIDIFPLDYANGVKHELLKAKRKCIKNVVKFKMCLNTKSKLQMIKAKHYRALLYKLFFSRNGKEGLYLQRYKDIVQKNSSDDGWAAICWTQVSGMIFQKAWFDDYLLMPFENLSVRVPKGYHDYLTCRFGDYMTLPPEDERVSDHSRYYINLEEGLNIDEVRERLKQGEYQK